MRSLGALAIAFALVVALSQPAVAGHRRHRRVEACEQIAGVRRFIRCAARVWDAPRTPRYAIRVARCESGLDPYARGGAGNRYVGLFQFYEPRWMDVAAKYLEPLEHDLRWRDFQANTIAAVRIAHRRGSWTGYWSCAR